VQRALGRTPGERQPSAKVFADELRGVAGFASSAEIADALRAACSVELVARRQQVARAVAAGRDLLASGPRPSARDTQVDDPGETQDLRRQQAVDTAPRVMPAMQLRDRSIVVERAAPVETPARSRFTPPPPAQPALARPRRGGHVKTAIIAGAVAAAIAATIVVIVLGRRTSMPPPKEPDPIVRTDTIEHIGSGAADKLRDGLEKMRGGLERLRDKLGGDTYTNVGTLVIEANVPVTIYAGDKLLGATPLRVDLAAGTYGLRAVLEDGSEKKLTVDVVAGQVATSRVAP
jgi:hypothetical protein